jgi:hypothetical protein
MTCKSQTRFDIESCDGEEIVDAILNDYANQLAQGLGIGLGIDFTVGIEAADVINVGIQVNDAEGVAVAAAVSFFAWLSDTAGGAVSGTAPSAGTAIGTDGVVVLVHTAELAFELLTDAVGALDLDIGEVGIDTWYLNVRLPDGSVVTSAAITFA